MTTISISDKAKALIALEAERVDLYERARKVSLRQEAMIASFGRQIKELSNEHYLILAKLQECKDASDKITLGRY